MTTLNPAGETPERKTAVRRGPTDSGVRADELDPSNGAPFVNAGGTAPEDRSFRPDIEGLRAVSVMVVVLYHYNELHLIGGYVGVDVFFVISGFVITGVLLRHETSAGKPKMLAFYGRRVLRIVPTATLVIAVAIIIERAMFGANMAHQVAGGARSAALFFANTQPKSVPWTLLVAGCRSTILHRLPSAPPAGRHGLHDVVSSSEARRCSSRSLSLQSRGRHSIRKPHIVRHSDEPGNWP